MTLRVIKYRGYDISTALMICLHAHVGQRPPAGMGTLIFFRLYTDGKRSWSLIKPFDLMNVPIDDITESS